MRKPKGVSQASALGKVTKMRSALKGNTPGFESFFRQSL